MGYIQLAYDRLAGQNVFTTTHLDIKYPDMVQPVSWVTAQISYHNASLTGAIGAGPWHL